MNLQYMYKFGYCIITNTLIIALFEFVIGTDLWTDRQMDKRTEGKTDYPISISFTQRPPTDLSGQGHKNQLHCTCTLYTLLFHNKMRECRGSGVVVKSSWFAEQGVWVWVCMTIRFHRLGLSYFQVAI